MAPKSSVAPKKSGLSLDAELRKEIRDVPDFPKPGIVFKDITPILQNGPLFQRVSRWFADEAVRLKANLLAGIESRGFLFAAAAAAGLGLGVIPLRKKNKLPWKKVAVTYDLEYGQDTIEAHEDACRKTDRVLLIDDLLATGGTAQAGCKLIETIGGKVVGCRFVVALGFLKGREKLDGHDVLSIVEF